MPLVDSLLTPAGDLQHKETYNLVMISNVDICIRGRGVVGGTTALLLSRLNLSVQVAGHASPKQAEDIRAYAINSKSKHILELINAWPGEEYCTEVQQMHVRSDEGEIVEFLNPNSVSNQSQSNALTWIVEVGALERKIAETLEKHKIPKLMLDMSDSVEDDTRIGKQAERVNARLTVICEGSKSPSKANLHTKTSKHPYGQFALATHVKSKNGHAKHFGNAYQWFNKISTDKGSALKEFEILALLPIGGKEGDSYAIVWSTSKERNSQLKTMSSDEFSEALCSSTKGLFDDLVPFTDRQTWPLTLSTTQAWSGSFNAQQSWVLCGDCAHSVHPLSGMGLNLGLADAWSLYEHLLTREQKSSWRDLSDLRLLKAYERERKLAIYPYVQFIDKVQRLFASDYAIYGIVRNKGFKVFNTLGALKEWTIKRAMQINL